MTMRITRRIAAFLAIATVLSASRILNAADVPVRTAVYTTNDRAAVASNELAATSPGGVKVTPVQYRRWGAYYAPYYGYGYYGPRPYAAYRPYVYNYGYAYGVPNYYYGGYRPYAYGGYAPYGTFYRGGMYRGYYGW
jgi:hypothetical protein